MEQWWNDTDGGKTEVPREYTVPVPLCPPHIPHGLAMGIHLRLAVCHSHVEPFDAVQKLRNIFTRQLAVQPSLSLARTARLETHVACIIRTPDSDAGKLIKLGDISLRSIDMTAALPIVTRESSVGVLYRLRVMAA